MKTAIRTYHPIPALSRTDGNLQDAPRIKHVLKASVLGSDAKSIPSTPTDLLNRCVRAILLFFIGCYLTHNLRQKAGKRPSTSVTNLIFVLAHHAGVCSFFIYLTTLLYNICLFYLAYRSDSLRRTIFLP